MTDKCPSPIQNPYQMSMIDLAGTLASTKGVVGVLPVIPNNRPTPGNGLHGPGLKTVSCQFSIVYEGGGVVPVVIPVVESRSPMRNSLQDCLSKAQKCRADFINEI